MYTLAVVSGYFLPSGGRRCSFQENEVYTQKEATDIDIHRKAEMADHTQNHTYTLKESVYEREGGAGDLVNL